MSTRERLTSPNEMHPDAPGTDNSHNGAMFGKHYIRAYGHAPDGEPLFRALDMAPVLLDSLRTYKHEMSATALAMLDAENVVAKCTATFKSGVGDLKSASDIALHDVRNIRFAVVSEVAAMTKPLADVRQFFLGADYKEQITRLKEFVDLCERLQRLKASGFLDSVADTMLRLDSQPPADLK